VKREKLKSSRKEKNQRRESKTWYSYRTSMERSFQVSKSTMGFPLDECCHRKRWLETNRNLL